MRVSPQDDAKLWGRAAVLAGLLFVGAFLLLSLRRPALKEVSKASSPGDAKVELTRLQESTGDTLVADEARFFDPTPLFLPTEWNTDQKPLPATILNDPGRMFQDFPSRLMFASDGLALKLPDPIKVPAKPADTIGTMHGATTFLGWGRGDGEVAALPARGGYLDVVLVNDGRRVLSEALPKADPPIGNWRPIELLAAVNTAGLVGQFSFVERSGIEEVDVYFQNYLVQVTHLGERLRPGFYRISVGP